MTFYVRNRDSGGVGEGEERGGREGKREGGREKHYIFTLVSSACRGGGREDGGKSITFLRSFPPSD